MRALAVVTFVVACAHPKPVPVIGPAPRPAPIGELPGSPPAAPPTQQTRIDSPILILSASAEVEDRDPIPMQSRSVALGIMGHGGRYLGHDEGGFGPYVEVAATTRRWSYFAELGATKLTSKDTERTGVFTRGGIGVRWLARSFLFDSHGGVDMNLEAFAGLGQLRWERGEHVLRPDLGLGVSYQVRLLKPFKLALRVSARAYFAPNDRSAAPMAVCRGATCTTDAPRSQSSGLMALFGLVW